jgi:hypothetical protein
MWGSAGNHSNELIRKMPLGCVMRDFFMEYGLTNEKQKNEVGFEHVLFYFRFMKKYRDNLGLLEDGPLNLSMLFVTKTRLSTALAVAFTAQPRKNLRMLISESLWPLLRLPLPTLM